MDEKYSEVLRRAERGSTACQIQLGESYLSGRDFDGREFPQDYIEAKRWFERAHAQGASTASFILGTMFEEGLGVQIDIERAIELYEYAAARGAYLPCLHLARIYASEGQTSSSSELARKWYERVLAFEGEVDGEEELNEARRYLGVT